MPFQLDDVEANSIRMVNSLRESEFCDYRFKFGSNDLSVDSLGYCVDVDGGAVFKLYVMCQGYFSSLVIFVRTEQNYDGLRDC